MRCSIRLRADADLDEIPCFIARDSKEAADRFLVAVTDAIDDIACYPM